MLGSGVLPFATCQARRGWVRRCVVVLVALSAWLVAGPAGATTFDRVSVKADGSQLAAGGGGEKNIGWDLSADGRFALFTTVDAPFGFSVDANGTNDVYLRDRVAATVELVSRTPGGLAGNGVSFHGRMSQDGRFVVFESAASNLVVGDGNGADDIFVRDRTSGTTERVSVASDGTEANNYSGNGIAADISADGRYVVFLSGASNLVAGDTNALQDVFLRDRVAQTTTRVSVAPDGSQPANEFGLGLSDQPRISDDGSSVVFASNAANLTPEADVNVGAYDIFRYDVQSHVVQRLTNNPLGSSLNPDVSADGRLVVYNTPTSPWISVLDRLTSSVEAVPLYPNDAGMPQRPRISGDGRFVTYWVNFGRNIWGLGRYDRQLAYSRTLVPNGGLVASWLDSPMSADGRLILTTTAGALVANDTNWNSGSPFDSGFDGYLIDTSMDPDPIPEDQTYGGAPSDGLDANPCLQNRTKDPINTATGAESLTVTDAAFPSPGLPFEFTRSYTSLDPTVGMLGVGWTHPFLASLAVTTSSVKVTGENGQRALYVKQPDGSFAAPPGVRARLVQTPSGYTLATRGHRVTTFDATGRLVGMTLRGQGLSFSYDASNKMASATDSTGRVVTFTYTTDGSRLAQVSLPDGRFVAYTYDATNRLQTVRDLRGGITSYTYDAGNHVASETDPNGHLVFRNTYDATSKRVTVQLDAKGNQTLFAWDAATQTSTMTDPRGGVWREVYSGNVLVQRIDPLGRTKSYGYDARLNCTSTTDGRGNKTVKEYDAHGNLTKVTSPAPVSAVESRTYDANDNLTSVTDPRGKTTTHEYDAQDRLFRTTDASNGVATVTYNAQSLPLSITNERGKTTNYGYDAQGNRTSATTPLGKQTTFGYDTAGRVVWTTDPRGNAAGGNPVQFRTSFTYNGFDQVLSVTDPLSHVASYLYDSVGNRVQVTDPRGKVTTVAYDELNRQASVTDPDGGVHATAYDAAGNVSSRTSATGGVTSYTYDQARQLTGMTMPRGNVSGATAETYTSHYAHDAAGNQTSVTDPADKVTTTAYDNLNRPTTVTDPLNHVSSTTYDAAGNVLSRTDGAANKSTFTYDNLGRLDTVTSPRGNVTGATATDYQTRFVYDAVGNRTDLYAPRGGRTTWAYDDDNRLQSLVDPRGYVAPNTPAAFTTSYTYDHAANLTRATDPLGNQTNYTVDEANRQTGLVDGNGKLTAYGYDPADELTSVTGPDAPACTGTPQCVGGKAATLYTYDNAGRLTQRLDPKNNATSFEYDLEGRPTKRTDPLSRFWTYTYDPDGNPATTTPARGNALPNPATMRITYTFDPVGRMTRTDYADTTPDVAYTYDDASRRTSMTDGGGTVNYVYDNADRVTNINRVSGDTWAYAYDPDSNVTSRTYPDATVVGATFDRDGNLATVAQGTNTTTFAYDAAGRLTSAPLPSGNGYVESRAYDNAGRLTQVKNQKGTAVLSQFTRTLDPVGNPTLVATLRGSTTTNEAMQYDTSNRLTKWCQAASCTGATKWISYAYDPVGSRSQQVRTGVATAGTTNYTYDNADQLTQTVAGTTTTNFTYDTDGNQTAQGTRTFAYDLAGRMKSTTPGSTTTNYTYDGNDLRLTRATGTTVNTRYSWDVLNPLPELALERNASNALIRRYVQGPAGPISMATSATAVYYFHRDAVGSVTDVTTNAGAAQWKYEYEPFGAALTTTKVNNQAPTNQVGFTGEYQDPESANYHLRARQYDPATGRLLATDPISPAMTDQSVTRYAYANDRPGVYTDPSGMLLGAPPVEVVVPDTFPAAWASTGEAGTLVTAPAVTVVGAFVVGFTAGTIINDVTYGDDQRRADQADTRADKLQQDLLDKVTEANKPGTDDEACDCPPITPGQRIPPPDALPAFPDAKRGKEKTPVQGGGGLRRRWKDKQGRIYEWDSKKGAVEAYDKTGKHHLGEFHPGCGKQIGPPVPGRTVEK